MPELDADFEISTNNLEAEYEISEGQTFDCSFEIYAAGTTFSSITGDPYDNEALSDVLNQKADVSSIEIITEDINTITSTLDSFGDIVTYNASDFATSQQGNLADTALQPNDNVSELVNDAGYLVSSDLSDYATLNDLATKQDIINDLTDIRNNASEGASAYSTIQNYGDIVTYDASSFATSTQGQKADTALQPNDNISELNNDAGYITSASLPTVNNSTVKFQKNGTDIETITLNQSTNSTVNFSIPTQASDINAVPITRKINNKALSTDITLSASDVSALSSSTTINDLTTTTQQNALNSGATSTNIGQITTNANDIADINDLIPTQATTTNQLADKSFVNSSIATNTANFIGTFQSVAALEAYSGTLTNNDYAFVETTDSAGNTLFDRYKYTTATTPASWQYEYELNNSSFTSNQWASINSGITSNDVTLIGTALQPNDNISELNNDAGYITSSSLPAVNNGTLTIQQNGTDVQTFTANQSSNVTANITVPTDTGDLTNGAGFITGITSGDVTTALGYTPYDNSNPNGYTSNVGTVTSVNNVSPVSGNVTISIPTDTSDLTNGAGYITGINSSDVITALGYTPYNSTNPNGYTSNVGTVTSVNNTQPDANGNVTISVTSGANTDLSNLTATGEAHFAKIFIATYGTTTYTEIQTAFNAGKAIFCKKDTARSLCILKDYETNYFSFFAGQGLGNLEYRVSSSNAWDTYTYIYLTSSSSEVASSRFDGEWVPKAVKIFNAKTVQNTSYDLANYLPTNYSTYAYEIYGNLYLSSTQSTQLTVGRISSPYVNVESGTRTDDNFGTSVATYTNSTRGFGSFSIVVGNCRSTSSSNTKSLHRYLYCQITGTAASAYAVVELLAYRRIGDNL